MGHTCPECGQMCYCSGDIDDIDFGERYDCKCNCWESEDDDDDNWGPYTDDEDDNEEEIHELYIGPTVDDIMPDDELRKIE